MSERKQRLVSPIGRMILFEVEIGLVGKSAVGIPTVGIATEHCFLSRELANKNPFSGRNTAEQHSDPEVTKQGSETVEVGNFFSTQIPVDTITHAVGTHRLFRDRSECWRGDELISEYLSVGSIRPESWKQRSVGCSKGSEFEKCIYLTKVRIQ
ncbi:hypothetical protein [Haladaptatus litoreus]|uniref:hypothetical protein n=1 Tax=Haladaptatus litoreus TaxID=553468 RepID=UPI000970A74D|nr:hypothetical protein [Haladaptatus litoreus]